MEVVEESPGVKTVCAQFRDPYLTVQPKHRQATVPPQALLSFPFKQRDSYAGVQWQGSGVGRGRPSDFKDIDRHFSIVKSLVIHMTTGTGHPVPPRHPVQRHLKLMTREVC